MIMKGVYSEYYITMLKFAAKIMEDLKTDMVAANGKPVSANTPSAKEAINLLNENSDTNMTFGVDLSESSVSASDKPSQSGSAQSAGIPAQQDNPLETFVNGSETKKT